MWSKTNRNLRDRPGQSQAQSWVLIHRKTSKFQPTTRATQSSKVELNYPQNQVRPHFYPQLMLSMIHSMLQTKDYKENRGGPRWLPTSCVTTFRLICKFQWLSDRNPKTYPKYLEIQKSAMGDSIHFGPGLGIPGLKDVAVSPLLLQTLCGKMPSNTVSFQDSLPHQLPFMKKQTNTSWTVSPQG